MTAIDFAKKSLVFVTGASQGIGRTICLEIAKQVAANSSFVLIARSAKGLDQTRSSILSINKSLVVEVHPLDLSTAGNADYERVFDKVLQNFDKGTEQTIFIHNAGQTGDLKRALELDDAKALSSYYNMNLFSVIVGNSIFFKKFSPLGTKIFQINITSLCGRQGFANLAVYGSGKAARELYFKVLAVEEPNVVVLNYSPGPVDTDMFNKIANEAQDEKVRKDFAAIKNNKQVLTTEQTVGKLLGILSGGKFKSGETLDYFDRI